MNTRSTLKPNPKHIPMSFKEFTQRREEMPIEEAKIVLSGFGADTLTLSSKDNVIVYEPGLWIEQFGDGESDFELGIGGDTYDGHPEYLETILYFHWYIWECVDPRVWTLETLNILLADYCGWRQRPVLALSEHLMDPENSVDDSKFFKWFFSSWSLAMLDQAQAA